MKVSSGRMSGEVYFELDLYRYENHMLEFINTDVQSLALSLADEESLSAWLQACEKTLRTCPFIDVVTRESFYFRENRAAGDSSGNNNEMDTYPQRGLQLVRFERASAGTGEREFSSGWKLYLLESGDLLFADFEVESDVTAGRSLGDGKEEYYYRSVETKMKNDDNGFRALLARIDDIRRQVRSTARLLWEARQGLTGELTNWTDDLGDWLEAKRNVGVPDEVFI
jgi:hypothetical protein